MRNLSNLMFLFILAVLMVGCKGETGDFMTSNGYKYTVHKKGSGKVAAVNDFIFYKRRNSIRVNFPGKVTCVTVWRI